MQIMRLQISAIATIYAQVSVIDLDSQFSATTITTLLTAYNPIKIFDALFVDGGRQCQCCRLKRCLGLFVYFVY